MPSAWPHAMLRATPSRYDQARQPRRDDEDGEAVERRVRTEQVGRDPATVEHRAEQQEAERTRHPDGVEVSMTAPSATG